MSSHAIVLEKITKTYYLDKPRTLKKWFNTFFSPFEKFTVLHDFSLSVKKGEFVLITGPNGCGKTTLLKLIAGITEPDKGTVTTYGKVVPLIELGSGFNYELTGLENIMINATILGISKKQIKKITPEIIDFAGLKNFIDVPVKRYSTGMVSRLAFSIAAHSQPEILLLDEVFSVGDEEFRKKSRRKLEEFRKNNVTAILCSHSNHNLPLLDRQISLKSI